METVLEPSIDEIEKILGKRSAQRILRLLVCWQRLSVKELVQRSRFSESQVHATLQHLEKGQIIIRETRGIYILNFTPFVQTLAQAYAQLLVQVVGNSIYQLTEALDSLTPDALSKNLSELIFQWEPILKQHYSFQLSSLANYIADQYIEE